METPKSNGTIKQPPKRKKLSRKFWLIVSLAVVTLIIGGWWMIRSRQTQAACVVGDPGRVYATAPAVKHMFAEERLAYRLRDNGQFVPIDEVTVAETADHEYSLRVSFDQPYINPRFGSKTVGTLELLEDGQPVTEPPKDDQGKLILPELSVAVSLYGASINLPTEFVPIGKSYNSGALVPTYDHHILLPVTNIYAPEGVRDHYNQGDGIDLSDGKATFEFNYFGMRHSPYLQITFHAGYATPFSLSKTLCFADQVSSNIPKVIDNLRQQTKTEFYYSVSATPAQLNDNKTTRVKLEITARDAKTNKVDTNPFQRVEINAVPLSQTTDQPISGTINTLLTEPRSTYQARGKFVFADPNDPEIEKYVILQTAKNTDTYTRASYGSPSTIFTDLVNGKATVYYDFSGVNDSLDTPLTFVVQPANFELKTVVWGVDKSPLNSASNRSKQNLTLPEKPTQFIGEIANPRLDTPDLPTSSEPDFLYRTWQTDAIRELVYTVYPIPVGESTGNWWSKAIARLAIWQILIVLFGVAAIAWQLHQQKNKNKTNDGQIK